MKKLNLLFLIGILFLTSCESGADKKEVEPITDIIQVIELDGLTKDEIFVKANSASVDIFVKSDSVIEFTDKESGLIKGKFKMSKVTAGGGIYDVDATITIESKDNKSRISISNIYSTLRGDVFCGIHDKQYPAKPIDKNSKLGVYVTEQLNNIIKSYSDLMSQKNNSDW